MGDAEACVREMEEAGVERNGFVYAALMKGHTRALDFTRAEAQLDDMPSVRLLLRVLRPLASCPHGEHG